MKGIIIVIRIIIFLLLFFARDISGGAPNQRCVDCTSQGYIWCPQQRQCTSSVEECLIISPKITWFKSTGSCSFTPILFPELCPELEVEFDARLGNTISGNMILVPVQPRILVFDEVEDAEYDVGGYFSYIPPNSLQIPEYFVFSQAVDRFVSSLHFDPYSSVHPDEFSGNATQVLQFLDMTVVGNLNMKYGMTFIVSRKNNITNNTCAFTPEVYFQQTPTYYDFLTTLLAVGLVVWTLGTFTLVNFMLYFNKREREEEEKEKREEKEKEGREKGEGGGKEREEEGGGREKERGKERDEIGLLDDSNNESTNEEKTTFREKAKLYWEKLKVEGMKFKRTCSMSDKALLADYGITLYHYIWFHRMALLYIGACTFVAVTLALPTDLYGGTNRNVVAGDFSTSTIASISFNSPLNSIHFVIIIINVSLSVLFVWTLRKRSFAIVVTEDEQALSAQEFAIEISGIPKGVINEAMIEEHFKEVYGSDQIVSAHLPLAYGPLRWKLEKLKDKKEKYEEEFEKTNRRPLIYSQIWHIFQKKKKVDAINYYEAQIEEMMQEINLTDPVRETQGTGYAYVTFTDREMVRVCLKHNNHSTRWDWTIHLRNLFRDRTNQLPIKVNPHLAAPHARALNCLKWKVAPAPLPDEIIWKNLENSKKKKTGLQMLMLLIELVVLTCVLSVTMLFAIIEVVRDLYLTEVYYEFGGATLLEYIASLTVVVLPEAVAIIEETVAPVVETAEEHAGHIHKSGWRRTVMWHTAFFELMSGLVISRIIYIMIGVAVLYDADAPLNSYHYLFNKTGMDMMKYMCIKTFTVYGIKYPALCLLKLLQAKISGEFERPEFDYFDLYAQKIVVMFCMIVYGSVMPLILPLGVMYLGVSFLYDQWAIVNFHKKDTLHDNRLLFYAADICSFYFTIAPLATLLLISKLFLYWPYFAVAIIIFSGVIALVMIETRRWQYMNQRVKGVRKIIKVSDHTFAAVLSSSGLTELVEEAVEAEGVTTTNKKREGQGEGEEIIHSSTTGILDRLRTPGDRTSLAFKAKVLRTRHVLRGVVEGMRAGVRPETLAHGVRTEEEILRAAYVHPLSKKDK